MVKEPKSAFIFGRRKQKDTIRSKRRGEELMYKERREESKEGCRVERIEGGK